MSEAQWCATQLPLLSGGLAVLELDAFLVGQWMISRPVLLGPLTGLACGRLWEGAVLGLILELLSLEQKPMGSVVSMNPAIAVGCAVLLSAGPRGLPLAAALLAGLALGWAYAPVESRLRRWRAGLAREAQDGLRARGAVPWALLLARSLGAQAAVTALFIYLSVRAVEPLAAWAWTACPAASRAMQRALEVSPWIGLASLVQGLSRKA